MQGSLVSRNSLPGKPHGRQMQAVVRERKACHINKSSGKKVLVCAPMLVCVLVCAKNLYVCSYVLLVFALVRAHVCAVVWLLVCAPKLV